jgi:predicted metal-dependent peptidase
MFILNPPPLDKNQIVKAKKRFDWALSSMIVNYKFVHHVLALLAKIPDNRIPTMGVRVLFGGKMQMLYNPAFVEHLSDPELIYCLYHEVMHLVLHHCTGRQIAKDPLANTSQDLAVNELIPLENGLCEPPRTEDGTVVVYTVERMKQIPMFADMKERQTAEYYYNFLKDRRKQHGKGKGDGKQGDNGKDKDGKGGGKKGDKPQQGEDPFEGMGSWDDHNLWSEDELAAEKIRAKIREIDRNNLWGNESEGFKEAVRQAQIKKINWRNFLRRFIGNFIWRWRQPDRKRPNRRMGYDYPGSRRLTVSKGLAATDTSGSIRNEWLSQFLSVINQMTDYMPIDLMEFDAEKTAGPFPFARKKVNYEFTGRGGTNFGPVMQAAEEGKYKFLAVLTDGEASPPPKPKGVEVVWILPEGKNPPVEWGHRIHIQGDLM